MYYVYIIESQADKSYYIGFTKSLTKRLLSHNSGKGNYTSKKIPWKIVYSEKYDTKKEAILRERQIKNWKSRKLIDELIDNRPIN